MNKHISDALSVFAKDSKYTRWYLKLVSQYHQSGEKHHIVPVSVNRDLKNDPDNIVILPARQHYVAHLLLIRFTTGKDRTKMIRALWFLSKRSSKINSRVFESYRQEWAEEMRLNNPMKRKEIARKISKALMGRTKENDASIAASALKRSQYTAENAEWLRISREKFHETVWAMTAEERKKKFGREMSEEAKSRLSEARTGKTAENCERVRRMAETIRKKSKLLSAEERKKRFTTTLGCKWYHNDELRLNKLSKFIPEGNGWLIGLVKYEKN